MMLFTSIASVLIGLIVALLISISLNIILFVGLVALAANKRRTKDEERNKVSGIRYQVSGELATGNPKPEINLNEIDFTQDDPRYWRGIAFSLQSQFKVQLRPGLSHREQVAEILRGVAQ